MSEEDRVSTWVESRCALEAEDRTPAKQPGQMQWISAEAAVAENKLKHVQMEEVEVEDL